MLWITDFDETDEILKSKLFYPTISLGPSEPIMGGALISLHGDAHTYRRRTEILMRSGCTHRSPRCCARRWRTSGWPPAG
jgi:hypothetical protein